MLHIWEMKTTSDYIYTQVNLALLPHSACNLDEYSNELTEKNKTCVLPWT